MVVFMGVSLLSDQAGSAGFWVCCQLMDVLEFLLISSTLADRGRLQETEKLAGNREFHGKIGIGREAGLLRQNTQPNLGGDIPLATKNTPFMPRIFSPIAAL